MKVKTYLCGANIILENGELLDDPLFRRLFFVTVPADDNLINEEKNACHSAIEDTLICYADRYGPPGTRRSCCPSFGLSDRNGDGCLHSPCRQARILMKTYTCSVSIILDNGDLLDEPAFNRSFSVVVTAQDDEFKEREAAREAAIVDSLHCYAQKFGQPLPRRVIPHLLFVRNLNGRITQIEGEILFQ